MDTNVAQPHDLAASASVVAGGEEATHVPPIAAEEPGGEVVTTSPSREAELQAENERLLGTIRNVEQWAQTLNVQQQQQAEEAAFRQREERIHERASMMSREDAERYIADEYRAINSDRLRAQQENARRAEQQWQERLRVAVQPQWVERHIKDNGLSDEERQYLSTLPPDNVPAVAQFMAAQKKQNAALKDQIEQLSRTQQAGAMQASGMGNMGGYNAAATAGDLPSDPDDRALAIYHQIMGGRP